MTHLSGCDAIIIRYIAENGPSAGYILQKDPKITARQAYAALRRLSEDGLIKLVRVDKTRPGLDKKLYGLTLFGLARIPFIVGLHASEVWSRVANQYGDLLPRVLGKWRFFVCEEVESIALFRMNMSCIRFDIIHDKLKGEIRFDWEPTDAEAFNQIFYDPYLGPDEDSTHKWLRALRKDPDLKQYTSDYIDLLEEGLMTTIKRIKNMKKILEEEGT